jgi:uncharacterized damage-inducible protein DinB
MLDAATLLDQRFRELDPSVEVPDPIDAGRAAVREMGRLLRAIPDADLARRWSWTGEGTEDVRTSAYVALAALHDGAGQVASAVDAAGLVPGPAGGALMAVSHARWELHGLLDSLEEATFEADPGGGEWSVRETVGHIVEAQRSYAWFSAWWLDRRDEPLPDAADESHGDALPSVADDASGTRAALLARIDALVDLAVSLWSPADLATLSVPARWSGFPVTLGFRTHRWAAHIEEHTLQVEKTLAMLGAVPSESQRLHRLLCRAWGDIEAIVFALPSAVAGAAMRHDVAGDAVRVAVEGALRLVRDGADASAAR